MPTRHALDVERKVFMGYIGAQIFLQPGAVVAAARPRHEIVDKGLGVGSADQSINVGELGEGKIWCCPFARNPAHRCARAKSVANVQRARKLSDLKPRITGKALVAALAGEHYFVALRPHLVRQREQRSGGSVEHWAFRRSNEGGVGVGNEIGPGFDHSRPAANGACSLCGFLPLVAWGVGATDSTTWE